jgi:hypothetical protein
MLTELEKLLLSCVDLKKLSHGLVEQILAPELKKAMEKLGPMAVGIEATLEPLMVSGLEKLADSAIDGIKA